MSERSVAQSWRRIESWLQKHAPETFASLRPPATTGAIAAIEEQLAVFADLGIALPDDVAESLRIHDGCLNVPGSFDVARSYRLLDARGIVGLRHSLGKICDEISPDGTDPNDPWWSPTWLLVAQPVWAGALIVDVEMGDRFGQVRTWDAEPLMPRVIAPSFAELLARTADLLEGVQIDDEAVPFVTSRRLGWASTPPEPVRREPASILTALRESGPAKAQRARGGYRAIGLGPDWIVELRRFLLTFVYGIDDLELLRRYGADVASAEWLDGPMAEAREATQYLPVVRVGTVDDWVFGVEHRHAGGVLLETLRRASRSTQAVGVGWDEFNVWLAYAENGEVLLDVRSDLRAPRTNADPARFDPLLRDVGLLPRDADGYLDDYVVAAFEAALRLGPGQFDETALARPLVGAAVLPLAPDPPSTPNRTAIEADPDLYSAIEYASEDQLRRAVAEQLQREADAVGLGDDRAIGEAIDQAARGRIPALTPDTPLDRLIRSVQAEYQAFAHRPWETRNLVSQEDKATWSRRKYFTDALHALLVRQAIVAAYAARPGDPANRADFLRDLGTVDVPANAIELLKAAERRRQSDAMESYWQGERRYRSPPK